MPAAPAPAHAPHRPSHRRLRRRILPAAVAAAALSVAFPALNPADAVTPMLIGVVGDVAGLSQSAGVPLAKHAYGKMSGSVPTGKFINMKSTVTWPTVAAAQPGSATYDHIVRWADTIKARGGTILFAFHHEPEAKNNLSFGTSTDYVAAYRRVVSIFRNRGVQNVEYTWQMTSWSFATSTDDRRYAAKWYPGDSYVTNVGTDPYNWYNCGPGRGIWEELQKVMDPSLAFARAHGKQLVVAEFASQSGSRRPDWLRNAQQYFIANRASMRGVFYFQYADPGHPDCQWLLASGSADRAAFSEMARNTTYFTSN